MVKLNWYKCSRTSIDDIPNVCGVYIISTCQKSDNKYAVNYIGQSENLNERIKEHFSDSESNEKLKKHLAKNYTTKISYAKCDSKF